MPESKSRMTDGKNSILTDQELAIFPPDIARELREALLSVPGAIHHRLFTLAQEVFSLSCPAASEFVKSCPFVIGRVGLAGLESWFQEGLKVLGNSEQSGIAYFRLGMGKSALLLERLSSGVELASIRTVLETYCLALTGRKTPILPMGHFKGRGAGRSLSMGPSVDGRPVFLPEFVHRYPSKPENFTWYKVMATHQVGHIEFGSYALRLDGTADIYRDLRTRLGHRVKRDGAQTDLGRFLSLFDNSRLATDIFTIVEDSRIDFLIKQQYRGIGKAYGRIQDEALSVRPPLTSCALREAFLEILVQISLGRSGRLLAPAALRTPLHLGGTIMKCVLSPDATVEDSADATMRLYRLITRVPSNRSPIEDWAVVDLDDSPEGSSILSLKDADGIIEGLPYEQVEAAPHISPPTVEFRGVFRLEPDDGVNESEPMRQDETETDSSYSLSSWQTSTRAAEMDDKSDIGVLAVEDSTATEESPVLGVNGVARENTLLLVGQQEPSSDEEALEYDGSLSYLYDEWDFRANDYRLRWCRVRQVLLDEGTPDFFEATLDEHAKLVAQIRTRFELLSPQSFRKVKRLQDGEDFDLDAVVDFVIGKKAGQSLDAKVYWRRNKTERDVSVAFLLDMSSSTIEYINRMQRESSNPLFPRDYKEYFEWLHSDHEGKVRPKEFKRIIDLEKEGVVLLIKALETIGDTYAIYGFSGYGRENVEFYVVKDLNEEFSDRVKSRIDGIAPKRGTRMGPAIRHATWKLEQQESKSRFLFLISDGRPEDHGYGKGGLEKEYAVNDTRMALLEAKRKGIAPFCLTFDRVGHDYLRTMCGDMPYEVVADIESLPTCLPTLYGRFTS